MVEVDPARSRNMAAIRSRDTAPELLVRKQLFARGFRYRIHVRELPGSPDLVFPKHRAVVLVHGCFWHRHHGCRFFQLPKTRPEFWDQKLTANAVRDQRDIEKLRSLGYRVGVVWECATRADMASVVRQLEQFLLGDQAFLEISR